jgi:hypothetical protein
MSLAFADASPVALWGSPGTESSANPGRPWAASWFPAAGMHLAEICRLKRGWNSYGAQPVDAAVAQFVTALLHLLDLKNFRQPTITPTARGGITLEWNKGNEGVEVSVERESIAILIDQDGGMHEDKQSITQVDSLLARALAVVHGW